MGKNESSLPKIPGVSWPDRDCRYMELEGCLFTRVNVLNRLHGGKR